MRFDNQTPLAASLSFGGVGEGRALATLVARATYDVLPDAEAAAAALQ